MTRVRVPQAVIDVLGANAVAGPETDLSPWSKGWRGESGKAAFVMRPADTEAVAAAVSACVRNGVDFVTQSGNTGLVSGSTPDTTGRQAVLSLERLNRIHEVDAANRLVRVGAGVRLSTLNWRLEQEGLFFPIDLGADPMVGGMVGTNTGGARFLRYGDVRANTLGVTVVLPDAHGTVLRLGGGLRKDNTGPDWKHLFIGTSGAFGVVTECVLNLEPLPRERATAVVVPRDDEAVVELVGALESRLGNDLSAFELMSGNAMRHALAHTPTLRQPFGDDALPCTALLVETARPAVAGTGESSLAEGLERALGELWERDIAPLADARFGPPEALWSLRHALSPAVQAAGVLFAFDLAFRRSDVVRFRASMAERLAADWPEIEICDFGHVADGGLHFNLVCHDEVRCARDGYARALREAVVGHAVEAFGASYCGEHGIGRANQRDFDRYTSDALKTLADRLTESLGLVATGAARFGHENTTD